MIQALGMETVFSNALTGCNLGAAVGGADFNPHNKSEAEIQRYAIPVLAIITLGTTVARYSDRRGFRRRLSSLAC